MLLHIQTVRIAQAQAIAGTTDSNQQATTLAATIADMPASDAAKLKAEAEWEEKNWNSAGLLIWTEL